MNALALALDRHDDALRAEIAEAVLHDGVGADPSLLAHAVAHAFADRLVRAARNGRFFDVVVWIEALGRRHALHASVLGMLAGACASARPPLVRRNIDVDDLRAVDRAIADVLSRRSLADGTGHRTESEDVDAAIDAFLVRLDEADEASAEHSRAVSLWCRRLARRLSLDEDTCAFVARGGLLHDVGKTLTPKEVLRAPRALTPEEWLVMREHAAVGGAMVSEVRLLEPYAPAARSHHERIDGSGYPDGLRDDEISLPIRIVTVADSFNAMIGRRPYRLPLTPAIALDQLRRHVSTQFDPLVVEAMIDIVERND